MKRIIFLLLFTGSALFSVSCGDDGKSDDSFQDSDVIDTDVDTDPGQDKDQAADIDPLEDVDQAVDTDNDVNTDNDMESALSDVADLVSLKISDVTLSEVFSKEKTTYAGIAEHTVETVIVTVKPVDEHSSVKLNGVVLEGDTPSDPVSLGLAGGDPVVISIVVTAEDGVTEKTYKVSVLRKGAPDPCAGIDCGGHGTCENISGNAQCNCDAGYNYDGEDKTKCLTDCIVITLGEINSKGGSSYSATYTPSTGAAEKSDKFTMFFDGEQALETEFDLTVTDLANQIAATPQIVRVFEDGSAKQYYQQSGKITLHEAVHENGEMTGNSRGELNDVVLAEMGFDSDFNSVFVADGACLIVEHAEWDTMPKTCEKVSESTDCTQGFSPACHETDKLCVECTADSYCGGTLKSACNVEESVCVECNVETEKANCGDPAKSVCGENHECVECVDDDQCGGDKPRCKKASNICAACTPETQAVDCTEAGKTICHPLSNTCEECGTNSDCKDSAKPMCHFLSKTCVAGSVPPPPPPPAIR